MLISSAHLSTGEAVLIICPLTVHRRFHNLHLLSDLRDRLHQYEAG